MPYCPYTDKEIDPLAANCEHIIPLSLGGSNSFTIAVDAKFNAEAGSKIDGALANDFLVISRRIAANARGHSKKKPRAIIKRSTIGDDNKPVQVEFFEPAGLRVYDPILRRNLTDEDITGQKLRVTLNLSRYGRLQFAAKVALAAGYFVFGEWFRENIAHHEARALMNFNSSSGLEQFNGFRLKGYDEFTPPSDVDKTQRAIDELCCEVASGSCVYFVPGPENIGITVGVLGRYVATLNIPGNTDAFPFSDENDLGHAIILTGGNIERISYRELIRRVHLQFELKNNG